MARMSLRSFRPIAQQLDGPPDRDLTGIDTGGSDAPNRPGPRGTPDVPDPTADPTIDPGTLPATPTQSGQIRSLGGLNGFPAVNLADYMHALQGSNYYLGAPTLGGMNGIASKDAVVGSTINPSGGYGTGDSALDSFTYSTYGMGREAQPGQPPPKPGFLNPGGKPPPSTPAPQTPPPPLPTGNPTQPTGPKAPGPAPQPQPQAAMAPPMQPGQQQPGYSPDDENRYRGLRSSFTEGF